MEPIAQFVFLFICLLFLSARDKGQAKISLYFSDQPLIGPSHFQPEVILWWGPLWSAAGRPG